jgi:glycosyltransferase involved in cell wall biosynthesis
VNRVLQIGKFYPPHMGGIETHLENLCAQVRSRFDVQVVACNHHPGSVVGERHGILVHRLATPFAIANAPVSPGLAAAIRAAKPDLVHIHLPHPGGVLGLAASRYRGPVVITYHSDIVRQRIWSAVFQPIVDPLLRRAKTIIVASPSYIGSSPVLGRHRDRCRVVPLGVPVESFERVDPAAVAGIRQHYGPRLVLGVGRFVYYKGFEFLIRAMRQVDGRLVLVGSGPLRAALESQAAAAGVAGKVSFVGEVVDLAPFYHAADVFVLPSVARSEAFGIVQVEAMACGTPVVNTSLDTGVPWVSPHMQTGLTVPPLNEQALADAITTLLDDDGLRRRLGDAGRARVRAEFGVELMGERVMRIYEDALR